MADLITIDDAHALPQITADHDPAIALLIPLISDAINARCKRSFGGVASYTELIDGGVENLIVQNVPIVAISAITDQQLAAVADSSTYDFDPEPGFIFRVATEPFLCRWERGRRRWKVEYSAGYASVPPKIKLAALTWLSMTLQNPSGLQSERTGDYSWTAANLGDMPKAVSNILELAGVLDI